MYITNMLSTFVLLCIIAADVIHSRFVYQPQDVPRLTLHKIEANWEQAYRRCKKEDAVLASPFSVDMLREMQQLIEPTDNTTQYYIGVRSKNYDGEYVSVEGISLELLAVKSMFVKLDPTDGDCISISRNKVHAVQCDSLLPYMCYSATRDANMPVTSTTTTSTTTTSTTTTTTKRPVFCDQGYTLRASSNTCYKYYKASKPYQDAQAVCAADGASLIVLNDREEFLFVNNTFSLFAHTWQGLREINTANHWKYVLGARKETIYFIWRDPNEALHYDCAALQPDGEVCGHNCEAVYAYTCEKKA